MNKCYSFKRCFDDIPVYLEMLNVADATAKEEAEQKGLAEQAAKESEVREKGNCMMN